MQPLRIILVMVEPPLPFGHACARWFYVLLRGLTERGHRVKVFATCSKPNEIGQAKELFRAPDYDLRCYPHPARNGFWAKWETLRQPYSYIFSQEMRRDLEAAISEGVDILHLESVWSGWCGVDAERSRVLLNFHSLYDIDFQDQPTVGISDWFQRKLRRTAEHRLLRSAGTLMTLSSRLKIKAAEIVPGANVEVLPLGIDLSLYPFIPESRRPSSPVITMIGSMDWLPSRSAAERLLTRCWPAIKSRVPLATLQIVGWNARKALAKYLQMPDFQILENVPDTRPFFEQSAIFFYAPLRGSGMKVKILEAFAYGVPVVTNSEGVEGLPAIDGIHAGICNDDQGLVDRAVSLLQDSSKQQDQRVAARALLEATCGAAVVLDRLESCYAGIVKKHDGPSA